MALRGNLRDFTITQLLNLVKLANKTGMLVVDGSHETAQVFFQEGKLAYAKVGQKDNSLTEKLQCLKRLRANQYRAILQRNKGMNEREFGLFLINAGYVTQDDILADLRQYFSKTIRRLFTWVEGSFRFENDTLPPEDRINIHLILDNLIIEGSRLMLELEQLQDEIPSLDMGLAFTNRVGVNQSIVNLNEEEMRVVSIINPQSTIQQIAHALKMNDQEIRIIVYRLLQAGLVEMTRPVSVPVPLSERMFPTDDKEEKKTLINRVIERIQSM